MAGVPELSATELVLRSAVAALLGAVIGIERELRERFARLRTHLLFAVGAALLTVASVYARDAVELGARVNHAEEAELVVELRDREAARDVIGEVERLGGGVASVEVAQRKGTRTLEIGAGFGHGERDAAIVRLSERERLVGAWWHAPS